MEKLYCLLQRCGWSCHVALILVLVSVTLASGQQKTDVVPGILHIKVKENLANRLEQVSLARSAENVVLTGVDRVDAVHRQFKVRGMKRVFRPAGKFEAKHRKHGLHLWYQVAIDSGTSVSAVVSAFKGIADVEISEPVYRKNNEGAHSLLTAKRTLSGASARGSKDPRLGLQWHYNQVNGPDIELFRAWEIETGNSDVIVAVVDGGIDADHVDLNANMWVNAGEIAGNKVDDDNNGFIDDVNGYNFVYDRGPLTADFHGTHVAGTVAATTNNGIGVAGVAGGYGSGDGARLMSCEVFTVNGGSGGFAEAYVYSADEGAVISQNSWGYFMPGAFEQVVLDAIDYFIAEAGKNEQGIQTGPMNGGIVIFAAGNANSEEQWYPAYYPPVIAVAGTNSSDEKSDHSNYGSWVDISAPGGQYDDKTVYSTVPGNEYGGLAGTSMACPHVSGVAALLISRFGGSGYTPAMVRTRLLSTTDNIDDENPSFVGKLGSGRLNAYKALQVNDQLPPEPIEDLTVTSATVSEVTLEWTAPADAASSSAYTYDIRYSLQPITEVNFESAWQPGGIPVPNVHGLKDSLTIKWLNPGTTYYFAIRSSDFFGNTSDISNVVEHTTAPAPVLQFNPGNLFVNLKTAQRATRTFIIANSGTVPLTFAMEKIDTGTFATLSQTEGTVAPGDTLTITVIFDAHDRPAGLYNQFYRIVHNGYPSAPRNFFLQMNVTDNGVPIATVENDTINFGVGYPGVPKRKTFTVHNDGSETLLITGLSSENPVFTFVFTDTIAVAPFENAILDLTFTGVAIRTYSARLTIQTNDPRRPTIRVRMLGKCELPPDIQVSPSSLHVRQFTGEKTTEHVTVRNTGTSDLEFFASFEEPDTTAVIQMLLLTPDLEESALAGFMDGMENIAFTVFPRESLREITLDDLTGYDVVLVNNLYDWGEEGRVNPPSRIGDLLADYVDRGGKVIINLLSYMNYDGYQNLNGRFIDEHYGPFMRSEGLVSAHRSLGTFLPHHFIMKGVTSLEHDGLVFDPVLAPGAEEIAQWDNGDIFIAANQNVVGFNVMLETHNPVWHDNLPLLYRNAAVWLTHLSPFTVEPTEGVVAAGGEAVLDVTFDATALVKAHTYSTALSIHHNVPGKDPVRIPIVFEVPGAEWSVSPDSVFVALEKDSMALRTVTVYNHGPDNHTFSAALDTTAYVSLTPASGTLSAGDSAVLTLAFDARRAGFGTYTNELTVLVDSSAQFRIPVTLAIVGDPAIEVEPRVLQASLGFREDTVQYLRIRNTGGSPLYYSLEVMGAATDGGSLKLPAAPEVTAGPASEVLWQKRVEEKNSRALGVMGGKVLLEEAFETGEFPPSGWSVVDNEGYGFNWNLASAMEQGNYCGTGDAAMAGTFLSNGTTEIDTELRTPIVYTKGYERIAVQFSANHWGGILDVDILPEGSTTWTTVLQWYPIHGGEFSLPGEFVTIALDTFLAGAPSFQLRWRHYIPTPYDQDYYSQIDDVMILGDPVEWLTVSPVAGIIPVGGAENIKVAFHAQDLEAGTYSAGILVRSNAAQDSLIRIEALLEVLEPAIVHVIPDSVYQEVARGSTATHIVTLSNTGVSPLKFAFENIPPSETLQQTEYKAIPLVKRTTPSVSALSFDGPAAVPHAGFSRSIQAAEAPTRELYATRFEEFYPGEIDGQYGWWADPGLWSIDNDNPLSGEQHFKGVSDGLGIGAAGTPNIGILPDTITSTTMHVNLDSASNVTWQIIPQAPTIGWVVTRLHFGADGSMKAFVQDSIDVYAGYFVDIPSPRPKGYFELRIEVEQKAERFSIYFNNEKVFTGDCFANFIEEVAILSSMEVPGPSISIDNLAIYAGKPPLTWVKADPASGTVPAGGSVPVEIHFDAGELGAGIYKHTFTIATNDPERPIIPLPVTMRVTDSVDNIAPVIGTITDTIVTQTASVNVTFTATDPDGQIKSIVLVDRPSFISLVNSTEGSVTYNIHPSLSDSVGEYVLQVLATDNEGASAMDTFRVTVLPYGIRNFSVIDTRTGTALFDFDDSVSLDAGHPDFWYMNIRANTSPDKVGSVQFSMDGARTNVANKPPYLFHSTALRHLAGGEHVLAAEVYSRVSATGVLQQRKEAVVRIMNTSAVTGFELTDNRGARIRDLFEGDTLDVSDPALRRMNVRAIVTENSAIRSVRLWLDDESFRTDNTAPYTLTAGNKIWWDEPGPYSVTAIPYTMAYGKGVPGGSLTVHFYIVTQDDEAVARATETGMATGISTAARITLYPIPAKDELHIRLEDDAPLPSGEAHLTIRNIHGQVLYNITTPAGALRDYILNLTKASLSSGLYYLQLRTAGMDRSLRFIKE